MPNYLIAGGGTGGHVYPGLAIAEEIKLRDPNSTIAFVGTPTGLETKIVPRAGFQLELIHVGKLNHGGSFFGKLKTVVELPISFWQSWQLLKKYQPRAVLGVGGYASGPLLFVAALTKVPTAIWEANAFPGLTNRWLSRLVRKAFLVFDQAKARMPGVETVVTGLPVRKDIEQAGREPATPSTTFRILVFGGSQGARALNDAVSELIAKNSASLNGIYFTHQTGSLDFQRIQIKYLGFDKWVGVHEFLYDMNERYKNADLVICRSGASTVAEITACGKVAIFIPLPTAADNHQQKNAELLVDKNAGAMLLQKDLTPDSLLKKIEDLRKDPTLLAQMARKARTLYVPNSAQTIADEMIRGLS